MAGHCHICGCYFDKLPRANEAAYKSEENKGDSCIFTGNWELLSAVSVMGKIKLLQPSMYVSRKPHLLHFEFI